ncbi:MAG: NAD(P)/FAD-dependent oxidoreductase, partial [Candidatus Rokubacteria bacterium]|nr:NAD(P)/FAD-dependent oxidoreductase [Candidatus Rokubacteria bacterium]
RRLTVGPDTVVIGAGISGLVDAILLAETGRRVTVLEQHNIPGGCLQQFRRKGTTFDVGFHYMGSTEPGRPMRQMLEHLRVWDRIQVIPFPEEAAIEVRRGARRFAYPSRFDLFRERALATWPHQRDTVDRLVRDVDTLCAGYKWFDLRRGRTYPDPLDLKASAGSCEDYLRSTVDDPWLREVLGFQSFNLGLFSHEIPWVKHALAFRSNFDLTCRIDGGGGALVAALLERGKELGVTYHFRSRVASFECEGREAKAVTTAKGERFPADLFVAACHPKPILRAVPDEAIRPVFKQRILGMKDSRGAFQVFLRLRAPLRSLGATCVMVHDDEEEHGDPPLHTLLVTYPSAVEQQGRHGLRLEAMTYMYETPFARWRHLPVLRRGEEYEELKASLARRVIGIIAKMAPELPDLVEDVYSATPLSAEWYTLNEHGSVFGISHDISQQGTDRPMPRMRLRNLFFTGQSMMMPGICGVFINAFDTCDMIRADALLFDSVAT